MDDIESPKAPLSRHELTISNQTSELKRFESWLDQLSASLKLSFRTTFSLDLIINEALINIISYGYKDTDQHQIIVKLEAYPTSLVLYIIDDGQYFDPLSVSPVESTPDLESATIGGRGILLMKSYADDMSYHRCQGKNHTRIVIVKDNDDQQTPISE